VAPGFRAGSNAAAILERLPVAAEAPRAGFGPELFPHWSDDDRNGCNTSCERFFAERRSDGTWFSAWDGALTTDRSVLAVDHVVSPAEAWDSGAHAWSAAERDSFADWPVNLVVATTSTIGPRNGGDAADWYPPRASANCLLAEVTVTTKHRWGLSIDPDEKVALGKMLTGCTATTSDPPPVPKPQPQPDQVITYSVVAKGSFTSDLETFAAHAAETLADPRGWSMGGAIEYRRVATGGDFTLVLSQASLVPSFGAPCDSTWSCRSGRYVIVNETRWRNASLAWTLGLDDYRHYVVIHELGHWLGQRHASCPARGAAAPVMMQQSISIGGCVNNVWPLPSERHQVAQRRGVSIRS
jgi:hypothetical protein